MYDNAPIILDTTFRYADDCEVAIRQSDTRTTYGLTSEDIRSPKYFPTFSVDVFARHAYDKSSLFSPVASFTVDLARCDLMDESERVEICSQSGCFEAEVCAQMFSPEQADPPVLGRTSYPVGVVLMSKHVAISDEKLFFSNGFVQAITEAALNAWVRSELLPEGTPVYLAYWGDDNISPEDTRAFILARTKDRLLRDTFLENGFSIFCCGDGDHEEKDGKCYMAVYSSTSIANANVLAGKFARVIPSCAAGGACCRYRMSNMSR